ncbi:cyclic nucleotide-binding protein [Chrysochromulina tobinii]|uniref:Cyclic nucleotide-binding protein n=1 Tax=Chrysochromulina tobinii TaxID=1460289 RepID=A0A0M0JJ36_9EUKA|nr:cyclic nucleotide-binding protein [Chrysochromulina tobinii]|eukprot:KOO26352.1 cyclic nucleotide-binding protein [Chrysochromulina sp. CCMP291]
MPQSPSATSSSSGYATPSRRNSAILRDLLDSRADNTQYHPLARSPQRQDASEPLIPSPPKVPPPAPQFLTKSSSKKRAPNTPLHNDTTRRYQEAYDEMHDILSALHVAQVDLPGNPWRQVKCWDHLGYFWKHMFRAIYVCIVPASSRQFGKSSDELDDGTEYETDSEGAPHERELRSRCLVLPTSFWREWWDLLLLALIMYSAFTVPLRVCFSADATGYWLGFEIIISIIFVLDIVANFNTVFFDPIKGKWVLSRRRIAKRYSESWLWLDLPGSVPVELIDVAWYGAAGHSGALGLLRMLRLFRLLRLLRLLKIDEYVEVLENATDMNLRFTRIIFMVLKVLFLAHVLGCFWFGMHMINSGDPEVPTWARVYDDGRAVQDDTPLEVQYIYSIYWAVTTLTTVGYGDVVPVNDSERTFGVGSMLVSALVFGYMMSNMSSLVAAMDRTQAIVEEKFDQVKEGLAVRFKKHYKFYYQKKSAFDELALLDGLSPSLRNEVTSFVLRMTLGNLPLFKDLTPEFQMDVFPLIRNVSYVKGEVVFKRGEPSRALFFLLSGEVLVYTSACVVPIAKYTPIAEITLMRDSSNVEVMRTVFNGCLGESVLTGRRRSVTMVASGPTEMLLLTKQGILDLFDKNYKSARSLVEMVKVTMDKKDRLSMVMMRFMISMQHRGSTSWAALIVQKRWRKFLKISLFQGGSIMARCAAGSTVPSSYVSSPWTQVRRQDESETRETTTAEENGKVGPFESPIESPIWGDIRKARSPVADSREKMPTMPTAATLAAIQQAEARVSALLAELKAGLAAGPGNAASQPEDSPTSPRRILISPPSPSRSSSTKPL